MGGAQSSPIQRCIRQIAVARGQSDASDGQLLERYLAAADEAAFEALVSRHGPLVRGVCTRILGHGPDADDAFQATFLVFVRKARSLRSPDALGPWLYGVAYRTALKARATALQRQKRQRPLPDLPGPSSPDCIVSGDLVSILDGLIHRLPHRYRRPFVLCYLEGKTNKEAAEILGCPQGTIFSRLAWARGQLQKQLRRHGLAPASAAVAAWLVPSTAPAALPNTVVVSTAQAATAFAAGRAAVSGCCSPHAAALAEGVLRTMFLTKLKIALVAVATIGMAGFAAAAFTHLGSSQENPAIERHLQPAATGRGEAKTDKERLQGSWTVVAVTEAGREIPEAEVESRNSKFVFAGDTVTIPIRDGKRDFMYKLDSTQKPRYFDLTFDGTTNKGIYLLKGDELKICVSKEADERPTEFAAPGDSNRVLMVLKRTNAKRN
jgi:RNA polymerase sigma-70 factor (ECF subfamily)